jgi:hypothetical protein
MTFDIGILVYSNTEYKLTTMLVKNTTYFFLVLILGLLAAGCKKAPNYAKEPEIEFDRLRIVNDMVNFSDSVSIFIKFKDGDGDLGNDPVVPTYFDFFTDIYKKTNGIYVRMTYFDSNPLAYNGYLPLLSPYTITGPIDGTVRYILPPFDAYLNGSGQVIPAPATAPFHKGDTLQFHVRIKDRAGNYSNWVESTDYVVWTKF